MNAKLNHGKRKDLYCRRILEFCSKVGLKKLDSFDVDAREVIMLRTGVSILNVDADICFHYEKVVTQRFLLYQKNCCNPFNANQNEIKGE